MMSFSETGWERNVSKITNMDSKSQKRVDRKRGIKDWWQCLR